MEVAVLNRILNFVLARGWTDYDNFSSKLAHRIANAKPNSEAAIAIIVENFPSSFFELNGIERAKFVKAFPLKEVIEVIGDYPAQEPLTFVDIFDETNMVSIEKGRKIVDVLTSVDERIIQNAIRDSLRQKNATNPVEREHDTPLEVADHEHFSVKVKGAHRSFVGVVKGYKSVGGGTITWKNIAHQVIKAYNRTKPDHVLLVLAKNPADSVVSEATEYGRSVGNVNLVVVCDPLSLARFLKARNAI